MFCIFLFPYSFHSYRLGTPTSLARSMFAKGSDPSDRIANALQYASFVAIDHDASSAELFADFERQVHALEREHVDGYVEALATIQKQQQSQNHSNGSAENATTISTTTTGQHVRPNFTQSAPLPNSHNNNNNTNNTASHSTTSMQVFPSELARLLPSALACPVLPPQNEPASATGLCWKRLRALSHLAAFLNGNPLLTKDLLMVEVQVSD
jgi:hypothetical protein